MSSSVKTPEARIEQLELAILKCDEHLQLDFSEKTLAFLRKLRVQHVDELAALRAKQLEAA